MSVKMAARQAQNGPQLQEHRTLLLVDEETNQKRRSKSKKKACSLILAAAQCVMFCGSAIGLVLYLIENGAFGSTIKNEEFNTYTSDALQQLFNISHSYGWMGGDVDTSFHLYNNYYLWLFGDSMIGYYDPSTQTRLRKNFSYPHSTIALLDQNALLSTLDSDNNNLISNSIEFIWRTNESDGSQPSSFFTPFINGITTQNAESKGINYDYWKVVSGVSNNQSSNCTIFLTAMEIQDSDSNINSNLNSNLNTFSNKNRNFNTNTNNNNDDENQLSIVGTTGIVVTNINDESLSDIQNIWKYRYLHMPLSNSSINWFVGLAQDPAVKETIYILGVDTNTGYNIIAQGEMKDLINLDFSHIRYYGYESSTNTLGWHRSYDLSSFEYIIETSESLNIFELNIQYSDVLKRWYVFALSLTSDEIRLYTSSDETIVSEYTYETVYTVPSPWNENGMYVSYAAKAHPGLIKFIENKRNNNNNENSDDTTSDDDSKGSASDSNNFDNYLVFSYIANAVNFSTLFQDSQGETYLPQMIVYEY